MALIDCPVCATTVSENAIACPGCGTRISDPADSSATSTISRLTHHGERVNKAGAWCPHCGNRNSYKSTSGVGCVVMCILFITIIGLLFIPFLPKSWNCRECKHEWRA